MWSRELLFVETRREALGSARAKRVAGPILNHAGTTAAGTTWRGACATHGPHINQ